MFNNKFTKKDPVIDAVSQVLESWDDDEDDDVRRADAELKRMKAKPIEADKKTDPDKEIGKLAKKTPKEVDESVEQIDEISRDLATRYIRKTKPEFSSPAENKKREAGRSLALKKVWGDKKYGLPEPKVKATEEVEVNEDKWTDIADGPWKKSNRSKSSAVSAAANAAGKGLKGAQHKLDVAKPKGKLTGADFKKLRKEDAELSEKTLTPAESKKKEEIVKSMKKDKAGFKERYGKRARSVMYATATKTAKKVAEETVSEAQGPTATYDTDTNFVTPANTTSSPVTPLQRVKGLAVSAKQRLNDTMMGKASATSEEIDPNVKTTDTLKGRKTGGKSDDVGPGSDFKSTKVKFTPGPK